MNITSPSFRVYSDGKHVSSIYHETNISDPFSSGFLPEVIIADDQVKDDINVDSKDPLSIALGINYSGNGNKSTFNLSIEYFHKIDQYMLIASQRDSTICNSVIYEDLPNKDWLTFSSGANSVVNIAFGYKTVVSDVVTLLGGIRTDFNYLKDYNNYGVYNHIPNNNIDVYHVTAGGYVTLFGHYILAGFEYSFGHSGLQPQFANFSDPVEYDFYNLTVLQGVRTPMMKTTYNAFSIFFGATFNFGQSK